MGRKKAGRARFGCWDFLTGHVREPEGWGPPGAVTAGESVDSQRSHKKSARAHVCGFALVTYSSIIQQISVTFLGTMEVSVMDSPLVPMGHRF